MKILWSFMKRGFILSIICLIIVLVANPYTTVGTIASGIGGLAFVITVIISAIYLCCRLYIFYLDKKEQQ